MPSSSARAHACNGPAPPKATRAKSRGSWPCSTDTTRSAPSISASTTATTAAGSMSASARVCRVGVEHDPAGKRRGQAPEQQVRVGHGRTPAAAPVAGRARDGSRALRPDPERSALVAPHDRPAARSDGVDRQRRQPDREAADHALALARRLAADDRADVGGGAAHVERNRVGEAGASRDVRRTDRAGRRARQQRPGRVRGGFGQGDHAAGRPHHEWLRQPGGAGRHPQPAEVAGHDRPEVRVGGRRRGALVLANLGRDLVRGNDMRSWMPAAQLRRDGALVVGMGIRMEQADGDRLDVVEQWQRRQVERDDHSLRAHALANPDAPLERHERLGVSGARGDRGGRGPDGAGAGDARSPRLRRTPCVPRAAPAARSWPPSYRG